MSVIGTPGPWQSHSDEDYLTIIGDIDGPDKSAALGAASAAVRAARTAIARARQHNAMEPDMTRTGIFQNHNCNRCSDGAKPCVQGGAHKCDNPHARND